MTLMPVLHAINQWGTDYMHSGIKAHPGSNSHLEQKTSNGFP